MSEIFREVTTFVGPPGSGKGTQAQILYERQKDVRGENELVFHFDQGQSLRDHADKIEHDDASVLTKLIYGAVTKGDLLPSAATIYHWVRAYGKAPYNKSFRMVMDGVWRTYDEIPVALNFLQSIHASLTVIRLNVPQEVCEERLFKRGRGDDGKRDVIQNRIDKYFQQTFPVFQKLESEAKSFPNLKTRFLEINGDQLIDTVASDIEKALA